LVEVNKKLARLKRHRRIRNKIRGNSERPRLCVYRSLKHIYAQVIDDEEGRTLLAASTLDPGIKDRIKYGGNIKAAEQLGSLLAKRLKEKGIEQVVFDRGGYLYHGRVKALAESVRKENINF